MVDDRELFSRFQERLSAMERKTLGGNLTWRFCMLSLALDVIEQNPAQASRFLDDFDRPAPSRDISIIFAKLAERPTLEEMRARFEELKGGIRQKTG